MNINDIIEIFYWLFQHDVKHEIFIKQLTYKIDLHCDQKGWCQKELLTTPKIFEPKKYLRCS